jgi:hypothetical protein
MYTTPQSTADPLSWASVRRDTIKASDRDFEKHASKFYSKSDKPAGVWDKLTAFLSKSSTRKALTKTRPSPEYIQRPGEIGTDQRPGFLRGLSAFEIRKINPPNVALSLALGSAAMYLLGRPTLMALYSDKLEARLWDPQDIIKQNVIAIGAALGVLVLISSR